jgi:hypothetical protein
MSFHCYIFVIRIALFQTISGSTYLRREGFPCYVWDATDVLDIIMHDTDHEDIQLHAVFHKFHAII